MTEFFTKLTGREKEIIEYIINQINESEKQEFIYTVRQLTETLKIHHKTLNKTIEKAKISSYFEIEDLGLRKGYKIKFAEKYKQEKETSKEIKECHKTKENSENFNQNIKNDISYIEIEKQPKIAQNQQIQNNKNVENIEITEKIIGREKEVKIILAEIGKRRDVLLYGEVGTGKTAILKYIYEYLKIEKLAKIVYADYGKTFKNFLINLAYQVHVNFQDLDIHEIRDKGEETKNKEWKEIKRQITKMTTSDLAGLIQRSIKEKDYIIICDQLETLTPTSKAILESIREIACLVGGTNIIKNNNHLKKLYWRFRQIEINNLGNEETKKLIEYHITHKNIHIYNKKSFIQKILSVSKGNPASIYDLIYHAEKEEYIDRKHIQEMGHEAGRRELDLTGFVVFWGVLVMATRFFALGMNNKDVYIIAGISGAFFVFIKFLLYKTGK
jgi:hypothetical protein